ncbi:MAG TPA: DUF4124 domain-containing protein [Burkholderiales bacterium]|nr:DUF4124 domain-containing protein [Burkholderiales bacterium]
MKAAIAFLVLLVPFAAHGQLLKCTGKDGRVEYATQCPPGTQEQETGIKSTREGPSGSGAASPQQKSIAEREADFRKRQMEAQDARLKDEKKTAEDQDRRAACEQAQTYLKSLQVGNRIARVDPKTGERVFLEDPDRPAEITRAQRAVDSNCK